eukprot:GCRY01005815.1.p3 GENE.GCRY01005815.1~~GCRY01005815.1.p3  ORF type:complete len:111 (-),score=27.39 GCRY01005815.1:4-336(-)
MKHMFDLIRKKYGTVSGEWSKDAALLSDPTFIDPIMEGAKPIKPALLHGDLHAGNYAVIRGPKGPSPVIFDPASYYGHSEAELGIMTMFGGFSRVFYDEYFIIIPKTPGF